MAKILKKKTQFSDLLSEFVILLKLGFLWRKLKIFMANFFHVSLNRFWRIFSMLLSSLPTIKGRWKKLCYNYFDIKPQFDWTSVPSRKMRKCCYIFPLHTVKFAIMNSSLNRPFYIWHLGQTIFRVTCALRSLNIVWEESQEFYF